MNYRTLFIVVFFSLFALAACKNETSDSLACAKMLKSGIRPIADDRSERFLGKVAEATARCRGGEKAVTNRQTPWVDWSNYWATGNSESKKAGRAAITKIGQHLKANGRGVDGALMDLEYQRIELIKFNLFDNYTYETFITGLGGKPGSTVSQWHEMRLPADHPEYAKVGGEGPHRCDGDLIRHRTLTGICNDIWNPKMGSSGTMFARNVQFEATFPRLAKTELARARHSDAENGFRLGLYKPDPQLISRKLFTRQQDPANTSCNQGVGSGTNAKEDNCDYQKAPFFNVLAAFWIQFMTHDWFSHLEEGHNKPGLVKTGCEAEAQTLGCRPDDMREESLYAQQGMPESFNYQRRDHLKRAYKTTSNKVSAWWDASQIYGYDETSVKRVLRDKQDAAKLQQPNGYLPFFETCQPNCPIQTQWAGQEVAAFPDNWNIGLSFYHNLFVREHNYFVDAFRRLQKSKANADSGLRHPDRPEQVIPYSQVSDEEIFQVARLVIAAQIAKIHTIEWTTQLLYGDPLYKGMNSNWFGLFNLEEGKVTQTLKKIFNRDENIISRAASKIARYIGFRGEGENANTAYSVFASGAGIFGLNNKRWEGHLWWRHDAWDLANGKDVNGGVNHFGSPFNFPEEFTTVYRLHPLLPDLIEYRQWQQPNEIKLKIPLVKAVRDEASQQMRQRGIENWALSMGRQRLGLLHLQNHPLFLQNLAMPHLNSPSQKLDIVALDIIRDRERGIPRFNEFRRQIGLKSLQKFDDFVDKRASKATQEAQQKVVKLLEDIYGTHICDASKIISQAQKNDAGQFINDCLGFADKTEVDNIEDLDTVVGWLAEYTRPHGYAISETQFHIFIVNASRRLFSDRFFTSSFRPEFYAYLGRDWVLNNGLLDDCPYPLTERKDGQVRCNEPEKSNGYVVEVSPLKRIMLRNIPKLKQELMPVINIFDPWARDRGDYYSLEWKARADAVSDPAFSKLASK